MTTVFQARYGATQAVDEYAASPTVDVLLSHRSVRSYQDTPLAPGVLESIVAAAQSASTSSNVQIWSVVAVDDPVLKNTLADLSGNQVHIRTAPVFLAWIVDYSRVAALAAEQGIRLHHLEFVESALNGISNASIAAQNAAVAAESLGLGTVYIGGLRNHTEEVIRLLQLPRFTFPAFGMCLGYPTADSPEKERIKPRLPASVVLHRNHYGASFGAEQLRDYEALIGQFYADQGIDKQSWLAQSIQRLRTVESLHGRDRLRDVLQTQGFGLS